MAVRTYDPGEHACSFAGIQLTAFGPDTFITAERDEDAFAKHVGAGGEVARTRNRNRSGRVTVTLLASSPENDLLSAVALLDEQSAEGVGAVFIKDLVGTTMVHAPDAWLVKLPATERAKELGVVEWAIDCAELEIFIGGNFTS